MNFERLLLQAKEGNADAVLEILEIIKAADAAKEVQEEIVTVKTFLSRYKI